MQLNHSSDNIFELRFPIYNGNYQDISKLFHFDIINMLFMTNNNDIIEQNHTIVTSPVVNVDDIGQANVQFLFYHLFKDCGIPQYYLNMKMTLEIQDNIMRYTSEVISDTPDFIAALPTKIRKPKPMPISKMDIHIDIQTPSAVMVIISFVIDDKGINNMSQHKRMVSVIFKKMFNRLKQFIETMS